MTWATANDLGKRARPDSSGKTAPSRLHTTRVRTPAPDRDAHRLAELLGEREREMEALAARLTLTEEVERQRIAQGLHDEVGQSLAALKVGLAELRRAAERGVADAVGELIGIADAVMQSIRSLTFSLSSPVLHQLGLAAAIENLLDRLTSQYGIAVAFEARGTSTHLPEDLSLLLHRSVRELLHNVAKHAQARRVKVSVRQRRKRIEICVEDDGLGFDAARLGLRIHSDGGFGLFSIQHALGHVGGTLAIDTEPGTGTRATLAIPLPARRSGKT